MAKKLIIVESANKIKSIEGYIKALQKEGRLDPKDEYFAEASVGHILEMPTTDRPKPYTVGEWIPTKQVIKAKTIGKRKLQGKASVVKTLKAAVKEADVVLVATDPDREGEGIADDLVKTLKIEDKYERITFNEITKDSLEYAIKHSGKIDQNMVDAQVARMLLDRVMGYGLSSWARKKIWNTFKKNTAGRVQSPTLKLVAERELLIQGFKPKAYFKVEEVISEEVRAVLSVPEGVDGNNNWVKPSDIEEIKSKLTNVLTVKNVKTSSKKMRALTPLKQSAVYKAASSRYGMSAAASRRSMQTLFEKGLVSYPRTDSTRYSQTFVEKAAAYIKETFGEEYIGGVTGTKMQGGAQDAHEALRPTSPKLKPDMAAAMHKLGNADANMYKLIYTHTLQSLMVSPVRESTKYELDDAGYDFSMSSSRVTYDGYYVVSGYDKTKQLPVFEVGQTVQAIKLDVEASETKPKARYNEGSLIEKMELVGIGRPSTFSSTVGTIVDRGRENTVTFGKAIKANEKGIVTAILLMLFFRHIVDETYTEKLEEHLDDIAAGKKSYKAVLDSFYEKFQIELETAALKSKESADDKTQMIDVSKFDEKALSAPKRVKKEYYQHAAKELIDAFMGYVIVTNKEISIDWEGFATGYKEKFVGVIMLTPVAQAPKRVVDPLENKNFPQVISEKDNKVMLYRGRVNKGKPSWFLAARSFPRVKDIKNIEEPGLEVKLEQDYQATLAAWESEQDD